MTDLADALLAGSRAAPNLDPSVVYGISQTSDLGDVPTNTTATQAYGEITKRVQNLKSLPHDQQVSYWQSIGDDERKMLTASGFQPPAAQHQSGLFGSVGHALGDVGHALFVTPGKALAGGVGDVLHAAGAPLRAVQHIYRAAALIDDQRQQSEGSQWAPGNWLGSPSQWAKAWNASEHGEQTFSPVEVNKIQQRYEPATFDLAKQLAGGERPDQIILAAPEEQRQALAQRIQSDPDLQKAVDDLNAAKISVGRRLIGSGLQERLTVQLPKAIPFLGGARLNPVSGGLDAVADWFGDPLVVGAKAAKGAELARYLVQGPDDVDRLIQTNTNVQNALADVAHTLQTGGAGALAERWPKLANVAPQLVKEGVDSPEALGDWFKGQSGMSALLSGQATGTSHAVPQMLKMNPVEQAALNLKGGLKKVIDWAADSPLGIAQQTGDEAQAGAIRQFATDRVQGFGRFARQLTTMTAGSGGFDAYASTAPTQLQRLASYVLPADRVKNIMDLWAAAPDIAARRQVYKGLLGEMFDAAGVTATEDGRKWASGFTSAVDDAVQHPVYSAAGHDGVLRDGVDVRRGLLENQLTTEWAMPSYRELWAQAKRANTLGRVYQGTVNADGVSRFMEAVWKPTTLLRLGFPIRAGGEELVGAIMREGPLGLVRGRLAAGAAQGEALGNADQLLPFHPLANLWDRLSGHLPDDLVSRINAPADYIGAVYGDRARRAFRGVEGALAPERYMESARELWRQGPLQSAFLSEVAATESRAAGYLDDTPTLIKGVKDGAQPRPAYFAPTGNFVNYQPGENLYTAMWRKNLEEVSGSQLGRAALNHLDNPGEAVQEVANTILSPTFEKMAARSDRMLYTTDGRVVGVDATREEAARDWAQHVVDHVDSIVRDGDGNVIGDIADRLAAGDVPSTASLAEVPEERMPTAVKGREVVQVSRNWVRDTMDKGFRQIVGRPMDWMVRQPLFIHNYATSSGEVADALRPLVGDGEHADQIVHDVAIQRAVNKTIPFIHDPQLRSQFAVNTRNLMPFWFAQEQFYKRWARVFEHSPEAFRQAQLTMMGLRHSGVLHTDDQGNDYFIYPGAGAVQDVLTGALDRLPGQHGKWKLPMPLGFSGQVRFATPGLERLGTPSFGPLVAIPMSGMAQMFPELAETQKAVLGDRGTGRSYWEMVTPTTVARLVHIAIDSPDTSAQMASAMNQSIQYLAAAGYVPPENAPPDVQRAFQDRVRNWTRVMFLTRMLYGYTVPASPELQMDPNQLHTEFSDLLKSLPMDQAVAELVRRHPDATPYTVFQSKSESGATLPASESTLSLLNDNNAFFRSYPQAGGWFLPQTPSNDKFDLTAYREQLALGLRERKAPTQFLNDVYFSGDADTYFASRDKKDAALKAAQGNSARTQSIQHAWDQWKADYLATRQVFSAQLQDPAASIRRGQTITQLRSALADPRLPKTSQSSAVAGLVQAWDQVDAALQPLAGFTTAAADRRRKAIKQSFADWATQYAKDHPEVSGLWNGTFRPEVEGSAA